jgi:hypothetical protein
MPLIQPTRRQFIRGAALLFAAPVIVRASSLMPVRVLPIECAPDGGFLVPREYVAKIMRMFLVPEHLIAIEAPKITVRTRAPVVWA